MAASAGAPTATSPPDLAKLTRAMAIVLKIPAAELPGCLVAASEADLPAVVALRREVIGADVRWDDRAYLRWRFRLDGARPPVPHDGGPGGHLWLVKRGDEVLGCLGTEQATLAFRRERIPTTRFMDMAVQPRLNGLGLGAWLALMVMRDVPLGISVGGNDQSLPMIERLFFRMPDRRAWSLPLRSRPLVALRSPLLASLPGVCRALDLGMRVQRAVNRQRARLRLDISELPDAIPAVDRLADTMVEAGYTFVLRSEAQWRWRFLRCPRCRYTLRVVRLDGRVVSVVATREGGEVAEVVDWLWDASLPREEARRLRMATLAVVTDRLARAGASRARMMDYDDDTDALLRTLGFVRRHDRAGYAVRGLPPERHEAIIRDPRWLVFAGDGDGD